MSSSCGAGRRTGAGLRYAGAERRGRGGCRGRTTTRLSPLRVPIPKRLAAAAAAPARRRGSEAVPASAREEEGEAWGGSGSQRQHGSGFFLTPRGRSALRWCGAQRMRRRDRARLVAASSPARGPARLDGVGESGCRRGPAVAILSVRVRSGGPERLWGKCGGFWTRRGRGIFFPDSHRSTLKSEHVRVTFFWIVEHERAQISGVGGHDVAISSPLICNMYKEEAQNIYL
jgi:hypothetical protein